MPLKLNAVNPLATKVKMKCGYKVRLLAVDIKGPYRIAGVVTPPDELNEYVTQWTILGHREEGSDCPSDLINAPEVVEKSVSIYRKKADGALYANFNPVGLSLDSDWEVLGCIPIKFTVGEGLEGK